MFEKYPVVLASASPQRKILLEQMGLEFSIRPVDCEEDLGQSRNPGNLAALITMQKMKAALEQFEEEFLASHAILCADTVVASGPRCLGKAENRDEAREFLKLLQGRTHCVVSAFCFSLPDSADRRFFFDKAKSLVRFRRMSDQDIEAYLDCGEWRGAAGAYRIQGRGACLVEEIRGSYTGIVGLPVERVYGMLHTLNYV